MKVILLKDVRKVGQRADVKNVSSGYALNFLIPRGLAEQATKASIDRISKKKEDSKKHAEEKDQKLLAALTSLLKGELKISRKANEKGTLFDGVSAGEIQSALETALGIEVSDTMINLVRPIKETGEFPLKIKIGDKTVSLKVIIEAET